MGLSKQDLYSKDTNEKVTAINNALVVPSGMYKLNVGTATDIKTLLANTIIDYTKLTSDNFALLNPKANGGVILSGDADPVVVTWGNDSNVGVLTYNATSGVLSFSDGYLVGVIGQVVSTYARVVKTNVVLFCDIATCLKSNWQDFV